MGEVIRTYNKSEFGYLKLSTFVDSCNNIFKFMSRQNGTDVNYQLVLEDIYFDYGQRWMYTSPITCDLTSKSDIVGRWQSICPRDYKILLNSNSFREINEYAMHYVDCILNGTDVNFSRV